MSNENVRPAKKHYLQTKEGRRNVINCVIAVLIAIFFLFPIYWLIQMSFKTDMESFGKIVTYYPHEFTIDPWLQNLLHDVNLVGPCFIGCGKCSSVVIVHETS